MRRAEKAGVDRWELEDQMAAEELQAELESRAPSETEVEDIAVFVFFPKADPYADGEDVYEVRAKISTLAWSGLTPEQAEMLRREGCTFLQGYLFSRPIPAREFAALLGSGQAQTLGQISG